MKTIIQRLHGRLYFIPLLLLLTDAILSLYEHLSGNVVQGRFTFFSFGITAGWISFLTGVVALFAIRKNELAAGLFFIHGFINSIALLVLSAFWSHEWKSYPALSAAKLPMALLKWLMLAMLLAGIFLGKKATHKIAEH